MEELVAKVLRVLEISGIEPVGLSQRFTLRHEGSRKILCVQAPSLTSPPPTSAPLTLESTLRLCANRSVRRNSPTFAGGLAGRPCL